ncbi:MAG: hypothetical protein L0227_14785 [Chloroflexi bacterium]|nr:hypothetical protein [Chloroflexota bacterium]
MTSRPPRINAQSHVVPRRPDGTRGRLGPHLGPLRITPARVVLAVAFVGSLAYIAYAVLRVEDSAQLAMVATGTGVLGLVFTALSVGGALRMWRSWQDGEQGRTVLFAIAGGFAGMIALGCYAGAAIFALVLGGLQG